jgi:hypothetical protein
MGSGLFGDSMAGEDASGGDSVGAVWAGNGAALARRPMVARKAQRNMEIFVRCRGMEAGNRERNFPIGGI